MEPESVITSGEFSAPVGWLPWDIMDPSDLDAETVGDALDVLQDLVLWELAPERWEHVGVVLGHITTALAGREAEALRDAVADLELSGPVRALRIGSADEHGIPEPVLELRNTLVHRLTREQRRTEERRAATGTEAGRGDQPAR